MSYNPFDQSASTILVTGPCNTFVYMKQRREENDTIFTQEHSQINNLEKGRITSNNYTCHSWSQTTGMILVCTDNGEMILCTNNGEFKSDVKEMPQGQCIDAVYSFSNGFVICAENNFIVYQSDDGDERALLRLDGEAIPLVMRNATSNLLGNRNCSIMSVIANEDEDRIYAITSAGQLITANVILENVEESHIDDLKFDYVLGPFHRREITGLDVCIRKELIATSSRDKTVCIWNYATKTHEMSYTFPEECLTVAFHPSGLHLVVAL